MHGQLWAQLPGRVHLLGSKVGLSPLFAVTREEASVCLHLALEGNGAVARRHRCTGHKSGIYLPYCGQAVGRWVGTEPSVHESLCTMQERWQACDCRIMSCCPSATPALGMCV